MNKKVLIIIVIIVIVIVLIIGISQKRYSIIDKNIQSEFYANIINIDKSESEDVSSITKDKKFFLDNLFNNMPQDKKKDFLENNEKYTCYTMKIKVENNSNYKANQINIEDISNLENTWVNEEIGIIAPPTLNSKEKRVLTVYIISEETSLNVAQISINVEFYINNPQIKGKEEYENGKKVIVPTNYLTK